MALTALSACRNNSGNTTDAPAPQPPIARADNATVAEESQGNRIDVLANDSAADTAIRLDSVEASSENGGRKRMASWPAMMAPLIQTSERRFASMKLLPSSR